MYLKLPLLTALLLMTASCVTSSKTRTNSAGVEVTYPDEDEKSPEFCNPTGKKGEELQKCFEFNETLYKAFEDEARQREPWFNFPPDNWVDSEEVDEKKIFTVKKEQEAVQRLEKDSVVELTQAEVELLSGIKSEIAGHKPYLIRGLYYFKDTGSFSVFTKRDAVLVRHDSLGSTTPKETRSGVIVYLPTKPSLVFVDCQVAE